MYDKVSANRNVVESEKAVEKFWKDNDVFKKSMEIREGCPTYMFYDGPPTANGYQGYDSKIQNNEGLSCTA